MHLGGICGSNPCQNGGSCEVMQGSGYICTCTSRFSGIYCEQGMMYLLFDMYECKIWVYDITSTFLFPPKHPFVYPNSEMWTKQKIYIFFLSYMFLFLSIILAVSVIQGYVWWIKYNCLHTNDGQF